MKAEPLCTPTFSTAPMEFAKVACNLTYLLGEFVNCKKALQKTDTFLFLID